MDSKSPLLAEDWLRQIAIGLAHRQHPLATHWVFGGNADDEGLAWIRIPETGDSGAAANGILAVQQQSEDAVLLTVTPLPPSPRHAEPTANSARLGLPPPVIFTEGHWQVIEQAKEGFAITDKEGCFVYMNREHLTMFGYDDLSQVLGLSWEALYSQQAVNRIKQEVFPVLVERRQWHGQIEAQRVDGSSFQEDLTLSLLPDGGIACNCRDRTAEVIVQRRLERSEALFRGFAENAPMGVCIKETTGRIRYVNRLAASYLGQAPEQIIGATDLDILPPDAARRAQEIDGLILQHKTSHPYELFLQRQGEQLCFDVVKFPLCGQDQAVEFICSIYLDTTRRRSLERDAAKVTERQAELLAMQREFISMISHEFRTPLTSIQGTHYLLGRAMKNLVPDDNKVRRYLDLQAESIAAMKDLADRVLMLNRIEQSSTDYPQESVAIGELLAKVVAQWREAESPAAKRIRLESAFSAASLVKGDPMMLRSAIGNLIGNALKFSPDDAPVQVKGMVEHSRVIIRVSDRGRGIPESDRSRLFEPFSRASNVGIVPGTGLGLSIVKRVAELHRGQIEYQSAEGEGSVFNLILPLAEGSGKDGL